MKREIEKRLKRNKEGRKSDRETKKKEEQSGKRER